MNILGIDYGKRRIGLAWAQDSLGVALPYGVIQESNEEMAQEKIVRLIQDEGIDTLVCGLPLDLEGLETDYTKKVRNFGNELSKKSGKPIEFIDERFTTRQAYALGGEASLDEKAAMLIVQSYLEQPERTN